MKIPHSIDPLTILVYQQSKECKDLISEQGILLDAQDLDWDNHEIPTLVNLCIKKIAFYFEEKPWFFEVPCSDRDLLLELLSLDLDLELVIPLIESPYYWKRRYEKHFGPVLNPKPLDWNWKSLYIEREVQRMIETAAPSMKEEIELKDRFQLCSGYVKRLIISQLQMWRPAFGTKPEDVPEVWPLDHINLKEVIPLLPLVEELDIMFGMNDVGINFTWNMFKVTALDCKRIGEAIVKLPEVTIVRIHKSKIEDKHCRSLMQGLIANRTIVELDMSNCGFGDDGTLCIANFLLHNQTIKILNLRNNKIKEKGTVGLAHAFIQPHCARLQFLDLSLNPLGREGVVGISRALVRSTIPEELSICAVEFSGDVLERIAQMMTVNTSLRVLHMMSNWFGPDGGQLLLDSLEENMTIEWIDMTNTGITDEQLLAMKRIFRRNCGLPMVAEEELEEIKIEIPEEGKGRTDEEEDEI